MGNPFGRHPSNLYLLETCQAGLHNSYFYSK
jgi:hypothetical protein